MADPVPPTPPDAPDATDSAPSPNPSFPHLFFVEQQLDFLHEEAGVLGTYCRILIEHLAINDITGVMYSAREIWKYANRIRTVAKMLAVYEHERNNA
jgi:hypothetical protein